MSLEYKFENRGTVQVRPTGSDKRSPCWYMLLSVLLLLTALAGWLFFSGYLTPANASSGIHAMTLRGKMDEQERLIAQQAATLHELEGKLASAKRGEDVQVVANEELKRKFAAAEADLTVQRSKLALYEEILSPAGLEQGLHLQHFAVKERLVDNDGKKINATRLYQYHLVLAHIRSGEEVIKGSYSIAISGKQDGKSASVLHKDVTPPGETANTAFEVKHYQSLEGNLVFPKDFVPESVKVKVTLASGETPERLAKSYEWSSFSNKVSAVVTDSTASITKE
ncbi:MAG: hypothetical protein BWK73_11325 [Thiothrix lacustris]|uniref:Uncharacterized protein n=1 Tax=Thiothrix lacustris TaxID=525917 RepID=A0A1Y1QTX5_9GAMM|nr:MAG: hypothetical protein BWK73_11325 [Thiothrix lacustris]